MYYVLIKIQGGVVTNRPTSYIKGQSIIIIYIEGESLRQLYYTA
jgi:hypothetical protein